MNASNPIEIQRIDSLWRQLDQNDESWRAVRDEPDFGRYTDHGGQHDSGAYAIYADGRQMAVNLKCELSTIHDPSECPSYTDFVHRLEKFIEDELPIYRRQFQAHQACVVSRKQVGAQIGWAVNRALQLWGEQIAIADSFVKILNLLRSSDVYRKENDIMDPQQPTNSITIRSGDSSSNQTILVIGHENSIQQDHQSRIRVGDLEGMLARIREAGVSSEEVLELKHSIAKDNQTPGATTKLGTKVTEWLANAPKKIVSGSISLGEGVTLELLISWIKMYFGIPI